MQPNVDRYNILSIYLMFGGYINHFCIDMSFIWSAQPKNLRILYKQDLNSLSAIVLEYWTV